MKDKYKPFQTIAYISFYMAIVIEVLMVIIDKSNFTNPIAGKLFQLTFVLCFIKVCLTRYTFKEYVVIFLFCVLGAVSYLMTGRNEIIRAVMLIAACKDIDMERCLKLVFWMTLAGCIAIALLSITGIYGEMSLTQDYGRGSTETRYTLGMGHPNALHCMVWALITLFLYLYGQKVKWYFYLILLLANYAAFLLSDSRTSFLVVFLTIILFYLISGNKPAHIKKGAARAGELLTVGSIGISIVIAANAYRVYNYDWHLYEQRPDLVTRVFVKLNHMLNGRIRILTGTEGWEGSISSWSLFSKPETEYYFDMGWVRLFYWYGIIPACVFILVIVALLIYSYRKEQYEVIMLVTAFSVYSIVEAHAISDYLARNYVFFLIGSYWCRVLAAGNDKGIKRNDKSKTAML